MTLTIHQFPCLADNYGFLVHQKTNEGDHVACVDTPDAQAILAALQEKNWRLTHIWNTHHHPDHVGGNQKIKAATGCTVWGPAGEAAHIPCLDEPLHDGDTRMFGNETVEIFHVPGHTLGHIAYHLPESKILFIGDTVFALGCGRLFEGTPEQMWNSLQKVCALDNETQIYCAHEYTQANARFALSVDAHNPHLQRRAAQIDVLRAQKKPTVPTSLAQEKLTNPFLRPTDPNIQKAVGMLGAPPTNVFAELRRRKDCF